MDVTKVSTAIRYSKSLAPYEQKTIELSAEGTVDPKEQWQAALSYLYQQLGQEMKALWARNGTTPHQEQASLSTPEPPEAQPTQEGPVQAQSAQNRTTEAGNGNSQQSHFCVEHNQEFRKRNGPHGEFYSHQIKGTRQWCNESKK